MAKRRENKFGYKLVGTQVILNEIEAGLIQEIYKYYINGLSASQILEIVNATNIKYYEDGSDWRRTNICMFLRDETYLGTEEYPQIISNELFDKVRELREKKTHKKDLVEKKYIDIYRDKMICAVCGGKIRRMVPDRTLSPKFHCKDSNCKCSKVNINQNKFEKYLKMLFAEIADGHIEIDNEADITNIQSVNDIKKKTNELRLHMQDIDKSTDDILNEIRFIASMRFDACGKSDKTAQTEYIVETLQKEKNNERVSAEVIDKVIKKILIEPDKYVTIVMQNDKKFRERITKKWK